MNPNTLLMGAIKAHICKNYSFFMRRGRSVGASYWGHSPSLVASVTVSAGFKCQGGNFGVEEHRFGGLDMSLRWF